MERAIADHEDFSVDRIEIDRPGPSYLVDTLAAIRERKATKHPPVFIVGQDAFAEMGEWREPERLFALADFAVMTRPPGELLRLSDRMPRVARDAFELDEDGCIAYHREADTRIELVRITALDVSSSRIRQMLREGRSIRFLVPEGIRESIEESGCYASPAIASTGTLE
ncbi:MAG: nicotinic acid mononucleotide adenylyltransferase [Deltaproteobacteria bacterium]|nr:nicotinic acid mononucleotide adenylyltransferase [Deltaproteobacteria bacterium]MBW2496002.1 nicotinic acid mononucleotide adenylyltransferase [Deltaproteobacteria bacterium]